MSLTMTQRATLLLMRVCDGSTPDWETSRADARAALSLSLGVSPDDIDSLGYDRTPRSYRSVRASWVRHVEQFGYCEWHTPDHVADVQADWAEHRPDLTDGDDWLAAGRAEHLARFPAGCASAVRGGCTLHGDLEDAAS